MLLALEVKDLLYKQSTSKTEAKVEQVHQWMTTGNRINWGQARVPSPKRKTARACIEDPLGMYAPLEGPQRRKTWLQSLPDETLHSLIHHVNDLFGNYYSGEIRGALSQVGPKFVSLKFLERERVKRRCIAEVHAAFKREVPKQEDSLKKDDGGLLVGESEPNAKTSVGSVAAAKNVDSPEELMKNFKEDMERHCREQFDRRVVVVDARWSPR